jgi:hypothetical protein
VYDESKDGRRGRKRTLDQLYTKGEALDTLIESIQFSDEKSISDLIRLIRSDTSIDEVVQHARSILRERRSESTERARSAVMSIANLIDEPPIRVPAKPWTNVTSDDDFVSHLISMYFTWHHESYPAVDREIFVQAMQSKDLDSQLCSPFLVNSLLLTACIYSDHPMVYAYDNDNATRGQHFADEVARLWSHEQGRANLTNLQGLVALSLGLGVLRQDRLAMTYARSMPPVCIELGRKVKRSLKLGRQEYASNEFQKSLQAARWSAFQMEVDFCMIWMKPLELSRPLIPRPHNSEHCEMTEVWRPYPKIGPEVQYHLYGLRESKFDLRDIGADIVPVVLSGDPDDSPVPGQICLDRKARMVRLQELLHRLEQWKEQLPTYAVINADLTPTWSLMELHFLYYDYSITVQALMLRDMVSAGSRRQEAKLGLLRASEGITEVFAWVQQSLGSSIGCPWGFQAATVSAYALLNLLPEVGVADTFHTLVHCIKIVAKRWILARGVLKMLWITLLERRLTEHLDNKTVELFGSSAVQDWGPEDYRLFESCMYPNYAAVGEVGRELADMGELLEQWSKMSVN